MTFTFRYKTKQFFFGLIKLSIVVGSFYFIYQKLANNPELKFNDFIGFLFEKNIFSTKSIAFLLFLTFLNWLLEIIKWSILVNPVKKISFKNAYEQSLGALTASLFTPNRIGEYGAKAIYYTTIYRKRIVLINFLSNASQMFITTLLGIIGFSFFITRYEVHINHYKFFLLLLIALCIISLITFMIQKATFTIKGFSLEKIKHFILEYPKKNMWYALLLSLLRYLVFSFQFYFLLQVFGIDLSYIHAMVVITSTYLCASIIPSIFIFDVVVKSSVAIYLFGIIGMDAISVLSTMTLMWLLNFVLPGILGSYHVINFKFPKTDHPS